MSMAAENVRRSFVQWALDAYTQAETDYQRYDSYYDGDHDLEFATDKWKEVFGTVFEEFSSNWCQVVVDAAAQRLKTIGWTCEQDDDLAEEAQKIYDESHVDQEEMDLTPQTLIKGDAHLIVWPSPEARGIIDMFYNDALDVTVHYDPKNKRRIDRAAKRWEDEEGVTYLNIYHPNKTEQFIAAPDAIMNQAFLSGYFPMPDPLPGGWRKGEDIINPYGIVPVFHFKNKSAGSTHGMSEMKSVIPVQNAINKVLMDMMIASEFGAFRQKWMSGGGHPADGWKSGPNRIWATTDPNARFGDFDNTDLEPYTRFVEQLVGQVAKITQTPMHYLRVSGDMPSGEALKTAESALIQKCKDRIRAWSHTWSHAMTFAVALKNGLDHDKIPPIYPIFDDPETRHDLEQAQTAQLKSILGVPLEQLWSEHFGYSQKQIDRFKDMNKAVAAQVLAQLMAQPGQLPPGFAEQTGSADAPAVGQLLESAAAGDLEGVVRAMAGMDPSQILALLPKSQTSQTTAGEATTRPQGNTAPPASPTRRSRGFRD